VVGVSGAFAGPVFATAPKERTAWSAKREGRISIHDEKKAAVDLSFFRLFRWVFHPMNFENWISKAKKDFTHLKG
jgi:hypothetical protein